MDAEIKPTFQGEVQLAGWSETHNGGCKVTFWLADATDLDVFRALTVRKGNTAGHRLACVLVEIGEDELPVTPPEPVAPAPEKPQGGALAKLAGMLCSNSDFWRFLTEHFRASITNAEQAAGAMREICKIKSRAELDNDQDAASIFHEAIRLPYVRWQQGVR
ncbi:hypothetical protein KMC50_gp55 [Ralstonia phage Claudette]|uniref:Uncharacterized protein n=2 Tax=Gervaisevirus claudettte TaxID=2846041 RepID=A0A7G5B854_9CAUD|nr:hypothetical protein KMC50_gp55 [Ralstonia phage Claudette]QMV32477.1 hypothetical protein 20A_00028 [Ralstonia phage Alix]QPD96373.1 hypothetical protein 20Ca_00055 [Ralstonia phage Claudette]